MTNVDTETGMNLRNLLEDGKFALRNAPRRNLSRFKVFPQFARIFAESPDSLLQALVDAAVKNCEADSAGISLEETVDGESRFRWIAVSGTFAQYLNGTTPRFFSPCGTCLDRGCPQLCTITKAYYDFLGISAEPITDGILIPWYCDAARGTFWIVSHRSSSAFGLEDYFFLKSLADFVSVSTQHQRQMEEARKFDQTSAAGAMAHNLAHRINNPLQSLANALYLAAHEEPAHSPQFVAMAALELQSLSQLVRTILDHR